MTGKRHSMMIFVLVLCLLTGLPCTTALAQESSSVEAPDPYLYRYEGNRTQTSSYTFDFRWVYPSGSAESWRGKSHTLGLFELVRTDGVEEPIAAYCADFIMSAQPDSLYRRLNLEDSTYFPTQYAEAMAAHIRGIFNHGYWYDWTEADLAAAEIAANEWLVGYESGTLTWSGTTAPLPGDAEDLMVDWETGADDSRTPIAPISNLTADEALAATQLAIWAFANTDGDGYWVDYRSSDGTEFPKNILAFRKYLLHQTAEPLTPENLLFSDDCFTSAKAAITTGSSNQDAVTTYDVTLFFKLAGLVDEEDDLTITATLGSSAVSVPLDDLTPQETGYYTLSFTGVSAEDTQQNLRLTLRGYQMANHVCFYQAKPAGNDDERETSQNLVGKANGLTPVYAETEVAVELGQTSASLTKLDGGLPPSNETLNNSSTDDESPLPGAVFDLYVRLGDDYVPVKRGLVTDAAGRIMLESLADGYSYYLKEAAAPDGYAISDSYHQVIPGSDITLTNYRLPVVPSTPVTPPGGGDDPDEATWQFTGTKTLDGQNAGGYTFKMVCPDGKNIFVRSRADGVISFPRQFFSKSGTYTYTLSEEPGEDTSICYDPAVYTAEVTVSGNNVTAVTLQKDGIPVENGEMVFANTTVPTKPTESPSKDPILPEEPPTVEAPVQPENPQTPTSPVAQVPATGDFSRLWQGIALLSAVALLTLAVAAERKRHI